MDPTPTTTETLHARLAAIETALREHNDAIHALLLERGRLTQVLARVNGAEKNPLAREQ